MIYDKTKELRIKFDEKGLIAAIAQDHQTNDILMLAWMNQEAFNKTLETRQAHYWSRSRQELWHKGATSGHVQYVQEILIDCDQDAVILKINQSGERACHTGRKSCFYRKVGTDGSLSFISE
jgi:phosphoribosyl-AMP cyclohydrolase